MTLNTSNPHNNQDRWKSDLLMTEQFKWVALSDMVAEQA